MPKFSKKQSLRKNRYSGGGQRRTNTKKRTLRKNRYSGGSLSGSLSENKRNRNAKLMLGIGAATIASAAMVGPRPKGLVPHTFVVADHRNGQTCVDLYELDKVPEGATCVAQNNKTHGEGVTIRYTKVTPSRKKELLQQSKKQAEKAKSSRAKSQQSKVKQQQQQQQQQSSKRR